MPDDEQQKEKISELELNYIVEKLEQRIYENIGKGVINRFLWIVGLVSISVYTYLKNKGII